MKLSTRLTTLQATLVFALTAPTFAGPVSLGQKADVDGVIVGRTGETMTVKTDTGNVVAVLTANTEVKAKKGKFGVLKEGAAATALIPGLKVEVKGVGDDKGRVIATRVQFATADLKTAEAIQAGMEETKGKVEANTQGIEANRKAIEKVQGDQAELSRRFGQLGDYDVKAEATVYFDVGSAAISEQGAKELGLLVGQAKQMEGYMIGVEGYADASGSASVNQKLSLDRSQAVVNWLAQQGDVPFYRMLAPGAMSTAKPAASNETAAGRSQNRRVVVKVLVNRGIAGQ
jgi:outer membrane protein OmpA-like peptidoglycan-associated protein